MRYWQPHQDQQHGGMTDQRTKTTIITNHQPDRKVTTAVTNGRGFQVEVVSQ
jgi:hypothetical protein